MRSSFVSASTWPASFGGMYKSQRQIGSYTLTQCRRRSAIITSWNTLYPPCKTLCTSKLLPASPQQLSSNDMQTNRMLFHRFSHICRILLLKSRSRGNSSLNCQSSRQSWQDYIHVPVTCRPQDSGTHPFYQTRWELSEPTLSTCSAGQRWNLALWSRISWKRCQHLRYRNLRGIWIYARNCGRNLPHGLFSI